MSGWTASVLGHFEYAHSGYIMRGKIQS